MRPRPPLTVLRRFGLIEQDLRVQAGGQERAWRTDAVIVKPVEDPVEAQWCAELLAAVPEQGFRISRPVPAADGAFVVDGWAACSVLQGQHDDAGRWLEILQAGQALHLALAAAARPSFLDERTGVWSVGDRVAWGEQPLEVDDPELDVLARELVAAMEPNAEGSQLIHGDLSGNVLFSPGLAPAIIDFTPYWRPASFGLAVVVVDAVCWRQAPPCVLGLPPLAEGGMSMVARAGLYRLIASDRAAIAMSGPAREDYLRENRAAYARLLRALHHGRRAGGR